MGMGSFGRIGMGLPALALLLAACATPDGTTLGVVQGTDGFGDYGEAIVPVPKPSGQPRAFQCAGPFSPNTTGINIAADFGQANVVTADVMEPNGATVPGVVLLPADPALRVDVAFGDAIGMTNPRRVAFTEQTAWTVNGLGIGSSLADVEKANGRPFRIQGFGGNAGGVVANWQGGRLANMTGGCRLGLQLALPATVSNAAQEKVSGPQMYSSSDPAMRAIAPTVGLMWVLYR